MLKIFPMVLDTFSITCKQILRDVLKLFPEDTERFKLYVFPEFLLRVSIVSTVVTCKITSQRNISHSNIGRTK
jgi:hypothetical protein